MKLNIPATLTCLLMNSYDTYAVDKELKATPSHLRSRRATASSNIISATPICQDDSSWFVKGNKKNEKGSKQQTTVGAPATKTCIDVASKPDKRCDKWVDVFGVSAREACPLACGVCTPSPTMAPSASLSPSHQPSNTPSYSPSQPPTSTPSQQPSNAPSKSPSQSPTMCTDTDNDGVCDQIDKCSSGNDNIDTDRDGIPDACDEVNTIVKLTSLTCPSGKVFKTYSEFGSNCNLSRLHYELIVAPPTMLGFPARSGCHNPLDYTAGDGSACCTYCVEDDTQNIKRTLLWDSTNGYAAQSETKRVVEKLALPFKQHIQQADNVGFCTMN